LADPKLKVEIMDKTAYCNKRRVILLEDTAENLANGTSLPKSYHSSFMPSINVVEIPINLVRDYLT
jgi:hypothetical protein